MNDCLVAMLGGALLGEAVLMGTTPWLLRAVVALGGAWCLYLSGPFGSPPNPPDPPNPRTP